MTNLKVLFRGDPFLINTYHALCRPKGATRGQAVGAKFIYFLISKDGQNLIREYGVKDYGEGLYNNASMPAIRSLNPTLHRLLTFYISAN